MGYEGSESLTLSFSVIPSGLKYIGIGKACLTGKRGAILLNRRIPEGRLDRHPYFVPQSDSEASLT